MTELLSNIHIVLQNARYRTWEARAGELPVVAFEDEAVMGFICVFNSVEALLREWPEREATLLGRYAEHLRGAGEKAWNVYCAFVTAARASDEDRSKIRWIEENLERTRKIAAAGLLTREDVTTALLPLLPIVSRAVLTGENPTERLRRRIITIAPGMEEVALDPSTTVKDALRRLREFT